MDKPLKLEFPKKSNSKRRRIFKDRTRERVRQLARTFYHASKNPVSGATVDDITATILDDYVELARDPDFSTKILHPNVKTDDDLIEKLYSDLQSYSEEKPSK
jgi:hypothetical protein